LEFKSSHDGSLLTFRVTGRTAEEITFDVAVKTPWFSGSTESSTYLVTPLTSLFQEMADEWHGWKVGKKWSDLEGRVQFEVTTDSTGHVCMKITLNGPDYDSWLHVKLMFEAGQLEVMARDLKYLFA